MNPSEGWQMFAYEWWKVAFGEAGCLRGWGIVEA